MMGENKGSIATCAGFALSSGFPVFTTLGRLLSIFMHEFSQL